MSDESNFNSRKLGEEMEFHQIWANISWWFFIVVMIVRPLNDIFRMGFTRWLMKYRQYLGIVVGLSAILHVLGYVIFAGFGWDFWGSTVWNFGNMLGWGMLALIFVIPPLVTSNKPAQKWLKNNWKKIQMMSYPAFIFTAIHISMVFSRFWLGVAPLLVWMLFWGWARRK